MTSPDALLEKDIDVDMSYPGLLKILSWAVD